MSRSANGRAPRQASKPASRAVSRDASRRAAREAANEPAKDAVKTAAKAAAKDAPDVAPKDAAKATAREALRRLRQAYPQAACSLSHESPLELLVATILSAQCTDARVNMVTPELFRRFPDAKALAASREGEIEEVIRSTGFFNAKARAIRGAAAALVERHGGEVPRDMDALVTLPGVGRKTANVVLGNVWNEPGGVVVDTHVGRLSRRLGWTRQEDPEKVERELDALLPRDEWVFVSHALIEHGRAVCTARAPRCPECVLVDLCPKRGVALATKIAAAPKAVRARKAAAKGAPPARAAAKRRAR